VDTLELSAMLGERSPRGEDTPALSAGFRADAVRLVRSSDRSIPQIADELGISGQTCVTGSRRPTSTEARARA
jgi:transposase-like protein